MRDTPEQRIVAVVAGLSTASLRYVNEFAGVELVAGSVDDGDEVEELAEHASVAPHIGVAGDHCEDVPESRPHEEDACRRRSRVVLPGLARHPSLAGTKPNATGEPRLERLVAWASDDSHEAQVMPDRRGQVDESGVRDGRGIRRGDADRRRRDRFRKRRYIDPEGIGTATFDGETASRRLLMRRAGPESRSRA